MTAPDRGALRGIELLERSLAWTSCALGSVTDELGGAATPCARWDLDDLLAHMVDSLTALTEAARGRVADPAPPGPGASPSDQVRRLRDLGCDLLGGWVGARPAGVAVDGAEPRIRAGVVVDLAALEVAVHGWDVTRTCHGPRPMPRALAAALLPVAGRLVGDDARPERFGPPRAPTSSDPAGLLLAHLGRVSP